MESIFISCQIYTFIRLNEILFFLNIGGSYLLFEDGFYYSIWQWTLLKHKKNVVLLKQKTKFLGHSVSIEGLNVLNLKVEAIPEYPIPTTRRDLKRFLGLANYYHRFVPKIAEITASLNELSGGPKSTNRAKIKLNKSHTSF